MGKGKRRERKETGHRLPGQRRHNAAGYVEVWQPGAGGRAGRWALEHRLVVAQHVGRAVKRGEVVHHLNEQKDDNRPQNLLLLGSASAHRAYHDGKAARIVWDGRRVAGGGAREGNTGPALRLRVVKMEPVRWRELEWFQGDLKRITPEALGKLKANLRRNGVLAGFTVWEESNGKRWILDGHQRKLAQVELEAEGWRLPEELPGTFVECRDRVEAAEVVLALSSTYGETDAERLVEFAGGEGLELGAALEQLHIPGVDQRHARALMSTAAVQDALTALSLDTAPRAGFTTIEVTVPELVPLVAAELNRLSIEYALKHTGGTP